MTETKAPPQTVEQELKAQVEELKARLGRAEHALASLAGPMLSQSEHDGHFFLKRWFEDFRHLFTQPATVVETTSVTSTPTVPSA